MPARKRFETLKVVEEEGGVGQLVLSRPQQLNALSPQALSELIEAANWFNARRQVRVVIVRGEGRAFCAGADLETMRDRPRSGGDAPLEALDLGRRMTDAITTMTALTVAAIHGHCVGGGVVLAAACDLRMVGQSTSFSIPEVELGLPLGWGGIPRLVRELGPAITKELVLTCRPFRAAEARELRFVNAVVADDELHDAVAALAGELAARAPYVLAQTKQHVNAAAEELASTTQSFRDAQTLSVALHDAESQSAMRRYLDRRSR